MKISILVSSQVKNMDLAKKFNDYLKGKKIDSEIIDLPALDLPLYSPLTENNIPEKVHPMPWFLLHRNTMGAFLLS